MPKYNASGFGPTPQLLMTGEPGYLYGSKPYNQSDTRFNVTNVALTSNVATVTIQILSGNIPVVGALVSILKTSSTSGLFNVTAKAITGVSITAATGAGTITFALTHADVVSAADTGYGLIQVWETAGALDAATVTTAPLCVDRNGNDTNVERTITAIAACPSLPTTATFTLQGAIRDVDAEYNDIGAFASVAAGTLSSPNSVQFSLNNVNFVRCKITSITGGSSPTAIVKVL